MLSEGGSPKRRLSPVADVDERAPETVPQSDREKIMLYAVSMLNIKVLASVALHMFLYIHDFCWH